MSNKQQELKTNGQKPLFDLTEYAKEVREEVYRLEAEYKKGRILNADTGTDRRT